MAKSKESLPIPELGVVGTRHSTGQMQEEFLPALKGAKKHSVYKEMYSNDPIVGAMLFAVEMIIRRVQWDVAPADKTAQAQMYADHIESCRHDMDKSWAEVISDIISFLPHGFSVHEKVYKKRLGPDQLDAKLRSTYTDGRWGWRRLPARAPETIERWVFNGNWESAYSAGTGDVNDLTGIVQKAYWMPNEVRIPRGKFLLFRNNTKKDNPESTSVLRNAYRPWYFKKTIEEIEAVGIERDLKGIPVFGIPPAYLAADATPEQKSVTAAFMEIAASLKNNEQAGLVMPIAYDERGKPLFTLELLGQNSSGGKSFDTNSIIQRYSSNIAQTILADFILLGQQSVGSFALSETKTNLFHAAIAAWLDNIADVFNKDAIPELMILNGWDLKKVPKLIYGTIDNHTVAQLGDYMLKLVSEGVITPDADLEEWARKKVDAPTANTSATLKSKEEKVAEIKRTSDNEVAGMKKGSDDYRTDKTVEVENIKSNTQKELAASKPTGTQNAEPNPTA